MQPYMRLISDDAVRALNEKMERTREEAGMRQSREKEREREESAFTVLRLRSECLDAHDAASCRRSLVFLSSTSSLLMLARLRAAAERLSRTARKQQDKRRGRKEGQGREVEGRVLLLIAKKEGECRHGSRVHGTRDRDNPCFVKQIIG